MVELKPRTTKKHYSGMHYKRRDMYTRDCSISKQMKDACYLLQRSDWENVTDDLEKDFCASGDMG